MSEKLVFDPSSYDGGGDKKDFVVPEAGSKVAVVVRRDTTEWRTSKRTGNKYLNVRFEVLNGPAKGYWLYYCVPTGDYMVAFLGRMLSAMGYDMTKKMEFSIDQLIGKRCEVKIKHEVQGGESRAVINYFMKFDPSVNEIPDSKATAVKRAPAPKAAPEAEVEGDDGLPF